MSGTRLDVEALFASPAGVGKLFLFFVLFLIVRGVPALVLYRRVLPLKEDREALALFMATQLPLVVAITTVAVSEGHMRPSTAAALVGAGALSTLAGPLHGLHMRRLAAHKRELADAAPQPVAMSEIGRRLTTVGTTRNSAGGNRWMATRASAPVDRNRTQTRMAAQKHRTPTNMTAAAVHSAARSVTKHQSRKRLADSSVTRNPPARPRRAGLVRSVANGRGGRPFLSS